VQGNSQLQFAAGTTRSNRLVARSAAVGVQGGCLERPLADRGGQVSGSRGPWPCRHRRAAQFMPAVSPIIQNSRRGWTLQGKAESGSEIATSNRTRSTPAGLPGNIARSTPAEDSFPSARYWRCLCRCCIRPAWPIPADVESGLIQSLRALNTPPGRRAAPPPDVVMASVVWLAAPNGLGFGGKARPSCPVQPASACHRRSEPPA